MNIVIISINFNSKKNILYLYNMSEYSIYNIIITSLLLVYYIHEYKKNNISNLTKDFLRIILFILFILLIYDNINLFIHRLSTIEKLVATVVGAWFIDTAILPNSQGNTISSTNRLLTEPNLFRNYALNTVFRFPTTLSQRPLIIGAVGTIVALFIYKDEIVENFKKVLEKSNSFSLLMASSLGLQFANSINNF